MPRRDKQQIKKQIRDARADVHADLAELDHQLHDELPARIREKAAVIAGVCAAAGLVIGFGGTKGIKLLLAIGIPVVTAAALVQRRRVTSPARPKRVPRRAIRP